MTIRCIIVEPPGEGFVVKNNWIDGVLCATGVMPDFVGASDDDETLEPHFNDTGDFGDNDPEDEDDDEE